MIEEYTRECLTIGVGAGLRLQDAILVLSKSTWLYGTSVVIRSDYGAELTTARVMC